MHLHPTGVEIIDRLLGGLTPGLPCVLAGPSGTGRTVLALQLAQAALERGNVVSFLCNEPAPFLLQQAETLGFALRPKIRSGHLALLELDADIAATVAAHGVEALIDAVSHEQPLTSLFVVDPFTVLTAGIYEEAQLRSAARSFVHMCQTVCVVLSVETERLALQQGLERVLYEICGAFLTLARDTEGVRTVRVAKRRSGVGAAESATFRIGEGGTQTVEPAPESTGPERDSVETAPSEKLPLDASEGAERGAVATIDTRQGETKDMTQPAAALRTEPPVILLVDDDPTILGLLSKWLEHGYQVVTARDGFEAMTMLLNHRPDLVVLDLIMPRVTGYELLAAFQRAGSTVPRLVISGRVERPADRLSPLVLGATDLLAKPVERFEFVHKVETLLRLSGAPRQMMDPREAEALFATVSSSRVLPRAEFHARLARAHRFGERFGLRSSLIAVSAPYSQHLDDFLEIADGLLRFEDGVLRVSKRRAVILLVATETADAPAAVDRLCQQFSALGGSTARLRWRIDSAEPVEDAHDWHRLFRSVDAEEDDS